MYARIANIPLKPGTEGEWDATLKNQGVPTFLSINGFKNMSVFLDRHSHESVVITFWETREQAEEASNTSQWRSFLERVDVVLDGAITVRVYELSWSAPLLGFLT